MEETLKTISAAPHGIHVLVIGECENRKHMSAYGYQRPTTPHLEKAAGNPHFILYTDTYSCHVQTVQALSYALTAKNQYNHIPLEKAPSLIECAKTAGFHTIWLSNQEKYSLYDTPTSVIASEADKEIWLNHNIGTDLKTEVYDGEIVNRLKNLEITSPTLLIIHHMMSLMEIDIPNYREKTNDITTPDYNPGQERFRTLFGEKKIVENNDSPK